MSDMTVELDRMATAGLKWVRFDLAWRLAETADGVYDTAGYLAQLDRTLDYAATKNIRPIVTVVEAPGWSNDNAGFWDMRSATTRQHYADFMGYLANRTRDRTYINWEIWSEPNSTNNWTGGPNVAAYTDLLIKSYTAIKTADPDARVLTGGLLNNDQAFFEGIYSNGGGNSFDDVAIHPYCKAYGPSVTTERFYSFIGAIQDYRSALVAHGQSSKYMFLTEWGWSVGPGGFVISEATRATYTSDAVNLLNTVPYKNTVAASCLYVMQARDSAEYGLWTGSPPDTAKSTWTSYTGAVASGGSIPWSYANLQAGINATATGGTLLVPNLTFNESVTVNRAMTIKAPNGATIDGQNTRTLYMDILASNITIDGFTMKNAALSGIAQSGSLNISGAVNNTTIRNCNVSGGCYAGLRIWVGPNTVNVYDSIFSNNRVAGVLTYQASNLSFTRCTFNSNNLTQIGDPGWESGGIKFANGSGFTFDSCVAAYNDGPGFWSDVDGNNMTIFNSNAHHNTRAGIMFEIGDTFNCYNNIAWRNGSGFNAYGWGAGILVSSSRNANVHNNIVAYNDDGISVISQDRGQPRWNDARFIQIHDNDVISLTGQEYMLAFLQDFAGVLYSSGTNNGYSNRYWHQSAEPTPGSRFHWNGDKSTLAAFNLTPGEEGGVYMTTAAKDALIAVNAIT